MAERAIFLDRDNTIIDNDGYLGDPTKVKLLTGAATALSAMRALGYRLIVVSNQSGVARGMFDEAAVEAVNQEMCKQLRQQANAQIDASYYCPYHPEAPIAEYKVDHEWRKPKPGMLKQAAADFNLDLSQSWMIGDMARDIAAGAAVGCRTILLRDPERAGAGEAEPDKVDVSPNYVVKTLADAARIIAREGKTGMHAREAAGAAVTSAAAVKTELPAEVKVAAGGVGGEMPTSVVRLEKSLEELVLILRKQSRNAELAPEFGLLHYVGMLVQILAVLAFLVGMYFVMSAGATFKDWPGTYAAVTGLERGGCWLLAGLVLQGMVIAVLLYGRRK